MVQPNKFMKDAGFKILALSRLNSLQYSVILYLINCSASGMDAIHTTHSEFASLMGYDEDKLREGLNFLAEKNMINIYPGDKTPNSVRISFEFDISQWTITQAQNLTHGDALVFPFMSQKNEKKLSALKKNSESSWQTILNEYIQEQNSNTIDLPTETRAAKLLAETHPPSQVSIILKHFGTRIKSLSLLASSWQHFQELFESEITKVDMDDARKKHHALDEQLRKVARDHLTKAPQNNLSDEEVAVLKVLVYHQHPRRQLYWAYQLHERYPNLQTFFVDHANLMLSITSNGTVIKKTRLDKKDK